MTTTKPIYMKVWFRAVVLLATAGAIVAAVLLATKQFPIIQGDNATNGTIEIDTDPPKATIIVDGKEKKEKSPAKIKARAGQEHKVLLKLEGYDDQEVQIPALDEKTPYKLNHAFTRNGLNTVPTPPAGQTAFRTYTSERYGYSVQYPHDWRVETDSSGIPHFYNAFTAKQFGEAEGEGDAHNHAEETGSLSILALPNPQNLGPEAWYKAREEYAMEDQSQIKQKAMTAGSLPAYQYETPYGFVPYINTVITGKGFAFLLQQKLNSPDREIYQQIVQSFKLL